MCLDMKYFTFTQLAQAKAKGGIHTTKNMTSVTSVTCAQAGHSVRSGVAGLAVNQTFVLP